MDARGGRTTSGAARLENGQAFDRPKIKTDRVSNIQPTGQVEQTPPGRDRAEGEEMSGRRVNEALALALTEALAAWITDQNAIHRIVASVVSKAKSRKDG
jgi:hypothetical protein